MAEMDKPTLPTQSDETGKPAEARKAAEAMNRRAPQARIDQKQEAAKAIRFMAIKAAIFILIPVIASALAVYFLL